MTTGDLHLAAGALLGLTVGDGWRVVAEVPKVDRATGGQHSRGYIVEAPNGQRAYLKALDYSAALASDDVAGELSKATNAYVFERDLLRRCEQRRLSRIVRALDAGQKRVEGVDGIPTVDYLILELATADVRKYIDDDRGDVAWALRTLHQVATGLSQLHLNRMAHQDIKPSNVLIFDSETAKIGDLGRALSRDYESPYEELQVLGTPMYAPIEALYGIKAPDWTDRCQSCDMYLLGSLCMFLFGDAGVTPAILTRLPQEFQFWNWTDTYREVLPFIRDAFDDVMEEFEACVPEPIREDIVVSTRELCDPDPRLRGHPKSRRETGSAYRLERYVSLYNKLATRVRVRDHNQALR
jgi:serine/threonine protein kinase